MIMSAASLLRGLNGLHRELDADSLNRITRKDRLELVDNAD
jgi:hypothetical protein